VQHDRQGRADGSLPPVVGRGSTPPRLGHRSVAEGLGMPA
jgi:hypothetical protein